MDPAYTVQGTAVLVVQSSSTVVLRGTGRTQQHILVSVTMVTTSIANEVLTNDRYDVVGSKWSIRVKGLVHVKGKCQ